MSHDAISNWVERAKSNASGDDASEIGGVQVIRREQAHAKGNIIMSIAEILRPWLMKVYEGVRDNNGLLVQPATVRAIALNVAQDMVNTKNS